MDSKGRFWVAFWCLVVVVLVMGMLCITIDSHADRQAIIEMVKAGAEPVEAACSLRLESGYSETCAALMSQRK